MELRVRNNKIFIVKRRLRNWVKYALGISISIITILLGIVIAYMIYR